MQDSGENLYDNDASHYGSCDYTLTVSGLEKHRIYIKKSYFW